jgi:hypothetical protein
MTDSPNVYVLSSDRTAFGLTMSAEGDNLPEAKTALWKLYDVIPLSLNYLGRYSHNPGAVQANLILRGYHLALTRGAILPAAPQEPPKRNQRPTTVACLMPPQRHQPTQARCQGPRQSIDD